MLPQINIAWPTNKSQLQQNQSINYTPIPWIIRINTSRYKFNVLFYLVAFHSFRFSTNNMRNQKGVTDFEVIIRDQKLTFFCWWRGWKETTAYRREREINGKLLLPYNCVVLSIMKFLLIIYRKFCRWGVCIPTSTTNEAEILTLWNYGFYYLTRGTRLDLRKENYLK